MDGAQRVVQPVMLTGVSDKTQNKPIFKYIYLNIGLDLFGTIIDVYTSNE